MLRKVFPDTILGNNESEPARTEPGNPGEVMCRVSSTLPYLCCTMFDISYAYAGGVEQLERRLQHERFALRDLLWTQGDSTGGRKRAVGADHV